MNDLFSLRRIRSLLICLFFLWACQVQKQGQTNHEPGDPDPPLAERTAHNDLTVADTSEHLSLTPAPDDSSVTTATVYLDSIYKIQRKDTTLLLIKGNLSNGCTQLSNISHSIKEDILYLDFDAWQPKDQMCTQVLTPFTYLYKKLAKSEIRELDFYMVRGEKRAF